ncbi:hypothetical protein EZI54_08780 [Marinobacter halodurans]|uniref:Uncharacterized protein n=1 Tax=Marinobacter halodurans TaxID=2528979 RepID=A0ABY1ZQD5_9GAMM|nr:hypothetical protein [Marinobacter halodurans]TBW56727.1 hypothetical protein EZI54_08780 [Marinobacter halodurans]
MPVTLRLLSLFTLTVALTACGGGGDDAVQEAGERPNSFSGEKNPADDFTESSTGDSNNTAGLARNEVRITVEVPSLLAPSAPLSRRNLHLVQPDSASVYKTNQTLTKISTVTTEQRQDEDGYTVIKFPQGQPVGPNVLIEVEYNGTRIRAFATDRDRDIKVNPFSEYVVRYGLGGYNSSEFATVMDCVESTDSDGLCINKFVWSTLADQIQDFEINIPDGTSLEGAVSQLAARTDLANYVDRMTELAQVPPVSTSAISADTVNMNGVYFGLELGRSSRFSSSTAAQWATQRAYEERIESDGVAYVYPGLSMTSFSVFGINVTSMATDYPYERATLDRYDNGLYDTQGRGFWDINSHATSPSAASIVNQDRLLAGSSLYQSITDKTGSLPVGWTRNPYFLDAHVLLSDDDYPDTLLANYFSAGKAIQLEQDSAGNYQRQGELENYFVSAFDVGLAQSDPFDTSTLQSDYNVISFSVQLGGSTYPFRTESLIGTWSSTGSGDYTQTATAESIRRDASGAVDSTAPNRDDNAHVGNRTSQLGAGETDNGRLNLLYDSTTGFYGVEGIGASNPDASLLAFNLDNPVNGQGILFALETGSGGPEEANYRLSGTIAGLGDDDQYLRQVDRGRLSITNVTTREATVSLAGFQIRESISTTGQQPPTAVGDANVDLTYVPSGDRLTFTSADGSIVLDGYLSSDREFVVLRYRETTVAGEEYIGLLLGARE